MGELLLNGHQHLLAILALLHIDEVDHDDSAQVSKSDLSHDLFCGFEVCSSNRVFELVGLADKLSGVDVDRYEGLGLIDDDVASGLEPDSRADRFIDFGLHSIFFEDGLASDVKLDAFDQPRLHSIDELYDPRVLDFVIDSDRAELFGELIAQYALYKIQVAMDECR